MFKAMVVRPEHWVDIEAMAAQLDFAYVTEWVTRLRGRDAPEPSWLQDVLDAAAR